MHAGNGLYTYTKEPVAPDSLTQAIQNSAIVVALESVFVNGDDDLNIQMKAELSNGDETILDGLVSEHDGVSLVQETVIQKSVRLLSDHQIMTNPRTLIFDGAGSHYKKIETDTGQFALRGGVLWVPSDGWDFGDTINVQILDRDNIIGLGATPENPFIISDYIEQSGLGHGEWGIFPNIANELIDEILSSSMPNGLYIHLNYIKADGATGVPKGILNLFTYET